jgi:hypothetical protein
MTSTITTSTVLSLMMPALAASLALIGIFVLIALLVLKEMSTAAAPNRVNRLTIAVNVGIAPLLIAFVIIVISKVIQVLK